MDESHNQISFHFCVIDCGRFLAQVHYWEFIRANWIDVDLFNGRFRLIQNEPIFAILSIRCRHTQCCAKRQTPTLTKHARTVFMGVYNWLYRKWDFFGDCTICRKSPRLQTWAPHPDFGQNRCQTAPKCIKRALFGRLTRAWGMYKLFLLINFTCNQNLWKRKNSPIQYLYVRLESQPLNRVRLFKIFPIRHRKWRWEKFNYFSGHVYVWGFRRYASCERHPAYISRKCSLLSHVGCRLYVSSTLVTHTRTTLGKSWTNCTKLCSIQN